MSDFWMEGDSLYQAWHKLFMFRVAKIGTLQTKELLEVINLLNESIRFAQPPHYELLPPELTEAMEDFYKKQGKEYCYTYEIYPEIKCEIDNLLTVHAFGNVGDVVRAEKFLNHLHNAALSANDHRSRRLFV